MIRRNQYGIEHDNPILARVRQFYDTQKSDPYVIFIENKNVRKIQVKLFDAQNNLNAANLGLPIGVSVNTNFNYTTGSNLVTAFSTATGKFRSSTTASFSGKSATYDLSGLTPDEAAEVFQNDTTFSVSTLILRDGASARLEFKFATDDDSLTNLVVQRSPSPAQTFALTKTDSGYVNYAGARSTYEEFLQQVMVRPMAMEGNFLESTNPLVIQSNDVIDEQADVTGNNIKTFLSLNLDPYMRSSQRTLPNFNLLNGQTSLTLTLPATSQTILYLFAVEEIDAAEQLNHEVDPESMTEEEIEAPSKPFDDYELPSTGLTI
tara:strand:- start:546 stop:1505 length:960 start_codon:yes stop_codon:yes gene_type:complete